MPRPELDRLRNRIAPLRSALLGHPIYARIDGLPALRRFMEHHVFAVWDFMALLKALQRRVCCVEVPWLPPPNPTACRLINQIVLGEESDEDGRGAFASHFELYRRAMTSCGARTDAIDGLLAALRAGSDLPAALDRSTAPEEARRFVRRTFEIIDGGQDHAIASAFLFGREDLLPDVFRRIVEELDSLPGAGLGPFRFYLDRHIELDGDDHGPMAARLLDALCGADPARWRAAEEAAIHALEARLALWDAASAPLVADASPVPSLRP